MPSRALNDFFVRAGLREIEITAIDILTHFSFEDYWRPFLGGQGPAPAFAMGLDEMARAQLRELIRSRIPQQRDGSICLTARAWALSDGCEITRRFAHRRKLPIQILIQNPRCCPPASRTRGAGRRVPRQAIDLPRSNGTQQQLRTSSSGETAELSGGACSFDACSGASMAPKTLSLSPKQRTGSCATSSRRALPGSHGAANCEVWQQCRTLTFVRPELFKIVHART